MPDDFDTIAHEFLDETKFFREVEQFVKDSNCSYIEATIMACDKLGLDFESLEPNKLIVPALRSKLMKEGIESGQLKKPKNITFDDIE